MFAAYWLGRLAIYFVLGVVRLVPVVGYRLSTRYESRLFRPVEESFRVASTTTSATDDDPSSVELLVTFENGSRFDVEIDGAVLRVGLRESGGTLRTLTWPPAIDAPPTNVETDPTPAGGEGTLRVEFLPPEGDPDRLWVEGHLVVEVGFELRGRRFVLGTRTFELPAESVDVSRTHPDSTGGRDSSVRR